MALPDFSGDHAADGGSMSASYDGDSPLAIIGWSNRFPGGATTSEAFWDMLCAGRTAHGPIPEDRFNGDAFYHADNGRSGTTSTKHAHFLAQDLGAFDASFFSISPAEAATMDPQQRLVLETAYHAFENAGLTLHDVQGSNTSVYMGAFVPEYGTMFARDPENPPKYLATGLGTSIIPSRVSWFYDLRGEALFLDTACSSSLTCLHKAALSLEQNESDMALVGGVSLILTPDTAFNNLSHMGFTSPDGRSYSFDQRANGYAKGEGVGIVIVKRLADAIRDGNTVRAVIRATGTNQDGRTPGITQPSGEAQERNVRAIYRRHGLDRKLTRFIEAHGTGTQVGDPIEAAAIVKAFQPTPSEPLYIGAVKSNIGHLETVAGLAGLIKVCMVLEKGIIPPNALHQTPNDQIQLDKWHIRFPTEMTPWPSRGLRRASLNSFGYGGTNAHAVLDDAYHYFEQHGLFGKHDTVDYPSHPEVQNSGNERERVIGAFYDNHQELTNDNTNAYHQSGRKLTTTEKIPSEHAAAALANITKSDHSFENGSDMRLLTPQVFVWSASDEAGLTRVNKVYQQYFSKLQTLNPNSADDFLHNLSHTLSSRRSTLRWKAAILARTIEELQEKIIAGFTTSIRSSSAPVLTFVFTGQGAQWAGMGKELLYFATFRTSLQRASSIFRRLGGGYDLLKELFKDDATSNISDPMISQSLTTAMQIALVDLLASWHIFPQAVVGHSSGEIAAAYCAGGLDFDSALRVAHYRGYFARALASDSTRAGGMIAVGLSSATCEEPMKEAMAMAKGNLVVACENSPSSVTISGDRACVEVLSDLMEARKTFARRLNVPVAYHSPHVEAYTIQYQKAMHGISGRPNEDLVRSPKNTKLPTMFSSVTGDRIEREKLCDPSYWTRNSSSTVKFFPALQAMANFVSSQSWPDVDIDASQLLTLEIGPRAELKRPIKDILGLVPAVRSSFYESILERKKPSLDTCLHAVAQMHCRGVDIDLDRINHAGVASSQLKLLVDLPPYPFNHSQSYWKESRISRNYRFRPHCRHELLGVSSTDWNPLEPHWRHFIKASENPWVKDHHMDGVNLYPASGMIVMVIEAARQLTSPKQTITAYTLKDLLFMSAVKLDDSEAGVEVQLRFHRPKHVQGGLSLEHDFSLFVESNSEWIQCARGTIMVEVADNINGTSASRYHHRDARLRAQHESISKSCSEHVTSEDFYDRVRAYGCDSGPAHQVLSDIRYSRRSRVLCASIDLDSWTSKVSLPPGTPSPHVIHPTALDGVVQLSLASFSQAGAIPFPTMVPVSCRSMWISNRLLSRSANAQLDASAQTTFQGFREADFAMMAFDKHGELQISVEDWREMAVTNLTSQTLDLRPRKICYGMHWKLDLDHLSPQAIRDVCDQKCAEGQFVQPPVDTYELASMYYLSIALREAKTKGAELKGFGWHTQNFLRWAESTFDEKRLQQLIESVSEGHRILDGDVAREKYLDILAQDSPELALTIHVGRNVLPLLNGDADPLELIYKSHLVNSMYTGPAIVMSLERLKVYFELLSHKNPNLKIVEIGAGTGSSTGYIMDAIAPRDENGERTSLPGFERYDFTDISPSFFEAAREAHPEHSARLHFNILNMEKDPESQGFEAGAYDVVYCGLVLHTLSSVEAGLRHARKLLKQGGKLIILESTNTLSARTSFVWGFLPGFWLSTEDFRKTCPLLPATEWDRLLKATGFSGAEVCMPDDDDTQRETYTVMVATAIELSPSPPSPASPPASTLRSVGSSKVILDPSKRLQSEVASYIAKLCGSHSMVPIDINHMTDAEINECHCIVLTELEKPWLKTLSEEEFEAVKLIVTQASSILWVTTGTGVTPTHPEQDLITGLGRNVRSEQWDTKFTHLALERSDDLIHISQLTYRIHLEQIRSSIELCEDVIREKNGQLYVARVEESSALNHYVYQKTVPQQPTETTLAKEDTRPLRLTIGSPGLLETLHFVDDEDATTDLAEDEIEVRTATVGLHPRDVLIALGKIPAQNQGFGVQFAGNVTRAAPETGFQRGDRVVGVTSTGAVKTFVRTKAYLARRLDDDMPFDAAAAMLIPWVMAYYALIMKADLQRDESVLIHNAASGVGQCAIQIAKFRGANIFVTAGNESEMQFLIDQHGVNSDHIFSSHSEAFLDSIRDLTDNRGVDVILNSLEGRLMELSWSLVAPLGRFMEIGKSDLLLGRDLKTAQFLNDVSFIAIDFMVVLLKAPQVIARILKKSFELHAAGVLSVPRPLHAYPLGEVESAFRLLQTGKSLGETIVRIDDVEVPIQAVPSREPFYVLDSKATYVVAGGFGGIGGACVKLMVARGARNFLIPTATQDPAAATQRLLAEIATPEVQIFGARCDISDEHDLKTFLDAGGQRLPPIKGCVQSTLALRDSLFANMQYSDWTASIRPKVSGTWNLHHQLPHDLNFFVVLSSLASLTGSRAQGNYAAGNAYKDAIVKHRLSRGQRAFGLNLGPILTVGVVAKRDIADQILADGFEATRLDECLALLDWALDPAHGRPDQDPDESQIATGLYGVQDARAKQKGEVYWLQRRHFSKLRNYDTAAGGGAPAGGPDQSGASLGELLQAQAGSPTEGSKCILDALIAKLGRALNIPTGDVEPMKPIHVLGIDSLVALEIRYWFMKEAKANLAVFDILGAASLNDLSSLAWERSSFNTRDTARTT